MMKKRPLTVTELARMGGNARAAKLSTNDQSRIGRKAVAAREADRAFTAANLRAEMREEYRCRYQAAVLDELRVQERYWGDEVPAVRLRFRAELRKKLERELRDEVAALFRRQK